MNKPHIIIIAGPTAVGKTKTSIELAKALNTEIISADSIQIYRGCDIGSAKVTTEEMQGIKHHLIDIKEPYENYSVKEYREDAFNIINELHAENKIPIVCGGTGFYINSLIYDMNLDDNSQDDFVREKIYEIYEEKGIDYIRDALFYIDKKSFDRINVNDTKRNIRAIEYFICTGNKFSDTFNSIREINNNITFSYYALEMQRDLLYDRINKRVDLMLEEGLIDEVKNLMSNGITKDNQSMQAIGYKEIIKYLEGEWDYDFAIDKLKQFSRNYAKRQLTWFRNDSNVKMIDVNEFNNVSEVVKFIESEEKNEGFL
ncbi:tRNA (adenosine(37)-N6)-dimethylallyltransferase MiaA [Ezakiella coagulans]|uniref:tRNA (adenosine(37)-N6)-dimethylallyltransferase MiaA n=1 Tax=Ezakiella coagulans TaxID=46507 RepID=UPI002015026D|nr:tRNA (adenosine(37)-N6)-dimethylallyltransferase MiaA [Ezakiella coagulans]UQK60824.1 tRNA (adenosine(37)-N6)-dimethylallyltransferase MiaA [Ezakiella coagulans]